MILVNETIVPMDGQRDCGTVTATGNFIRHAVGQPDLATAILDCGAGHPNNCVPPPFCSPRRGERFFSLTISD
jgi:hypothetical protein